MGIDVYLTWDNQTEAEKKAQYTGFSVEAGKVGYLREAYHGSPYATHALFARRYWDGDEDARADVPELKRRLPATVLISLYRNEMLYGTGEDPQRQNSLEDAMQKIKEVFAEDKAGSTETMVERITPEQIAGAQRLIDSRQLPDYALAFVDFVALAEKMESEGRNPVVVISY